MIKYLIKNHGSNVHTAPPIPANDGDGISRSDFLEGEWVVVDGMGAVRNGFAAGAILAGNAAPSPIIGAIPTLQCLGGQSSFKPQSKRQSQKFGADVAKLKSGRLSF